MPITRIISGGQSGADVGALDAAIFCKIPHGGWCPKGRKQELGKTIPEKYQLKEMDSADYLKRNEANVVDSDATLILTLGALTVGSKRTWDFAKKHKKPCLHVEIDQFSREGLVYLVRQWFQGDIGKVKPPKNCVLNVAGNRESGAPGIRQMVMVRMVDILTEINGLSFYPLSDEYDPDDESVPASEADLSALEEWADSIIPSTPELYHPKTIQEAVDILCSKYPEANKAEIRKQDKDEFATWSHFGLGMAIRNTMIYQNLNMIDLMADFQKGCRAGKWEGAAEPDNVSSVIVEMFWTRLHHS